MTNPSSPPPSSPSAVALRLEEAVGQTVRGKPEVIRMLLTALFCRGHVLLEDVPGVGKTTLARSLARALGGSFRRIQFTSDLLPSDILGVSILDPETNSFEFKPGPIFAHVVLADEINRTTPRTQSALLEAMNEGQITVDSTTHPLEDPFLIVATQNPVEFFGTYPLPESQLDRFLFRLSMGYPPPEEERQLLVERGGYDLLDGVKACVDLEEVRSIQRKVDTIRVDTSLVDYAHKIVLATREHPRIEIGVSPRGAIQWFRSAQGHALVEGRD